MRISTVLTLLTNSSKFSLLWIFKGKTKVLKQKDLYNNQNIKKYFILVKY